MKILFVCTGNTCRSPMAQVLLEKIAKDKGLNIEVKSAGIFALDGQKASANAIEVMKQEGIDLENHRARIIHRDLLEEADLILTMSKSHKEALLSKFDFVKGKVYTLKEYAYGKEEDIEDPFGGDIRDYRRAKEEIKEALKQLTTLINGQLTGDN
ncbi:low molecular weight protein arginine phosphatase [Tepidimicrobium xylanilyticum]|uniref:Protein-tyrosine phosphatase n=1 Tax=Tepidimicrobium xylanilyticum TaxID=1123352 RepID=A0A1H2R2X7_9FIRM|nr:low molecular weight protein arginine phosphatase [Tepidimicrobium xylanilyticum]GMG95532.1 protein-tyrosine-phosphatase [Tepidimicrobium xylanilyticum]SDW13490.1 protein-tyrosine phosphatase [Tepidimicrobium xylanilyticum]